MVSQHQFMKHPGYYSGQDSTCSNNIANHWAPALRLKRASASLGHYARLSLDVIRVTADGRRFTLWNFALRTRHRRDSTGQARTFTDFFIYRPLAPLARAHRVRRELYIHSLGDRTKLPRCGRTHAEALGPFRRPIREEKSQLLFFPNGHHHALSALLLSNAKSLITHYLKDRGGLF